MKKTLVVLTLIWVIKWFASAEDLLTFMNAQPPASMVTAKVLYSSYSCFRCYGLVWDTAS